MPTNAERIQNAIDDLCKIVEAKTAEWVTAGCPPTYSIDGESYQWGEWLKNKTEEIKALKATLAVIGGPFVVRSRGRA